MTTTKWFITTASSLGISILNYFFGGWSTPLAVLLFMVVVDWITGFCSAFLNKKTDSRVGAKGAIKKILYFILVAVVYQACQALPIDMAGDAGIIIETSIYTFVITSLIINDFVSIIENLTEMGVPIPKVLIERLSQLNKQK